MTNKDRIGLIVWFWGLGALILSNPDKFDFAYFLVIFCAMLGTLLLGSEK